MATTKRATLPPKIKDAPAGYYFSSLSIAQVRSFGTKQNIRLADDTGKPFQWTIILGDNGVGKTSILKSLVSLAPSPKNIFGRYSSNKPYPGLMDWRERWDTRRGTGTSPSIISAKVIAGTTLKKAGQDTPLEIRIQQGHHSFNDIEYSEPAYTRLNHFLCFAYGASRKMGSSNLSSDKFSTASISLFDDEAPLINVEEFFMQADYEAKTQKSSEATSQRETVRKLLLDILPEVKGLRVAKGTGMGRNVEVETPYGWVRISELSLGYKSLIAWVVDFASRMYYYHQELENPFSAPAVVLIDEIDLHLHPKWQRKIMGYLGRKFPNTQFIASAHSPLIVQAALDANLVLLKRRGGQAVVVNEPEVIKSWRIDQILTSDLFGLASSRSEESSRLINERRKLLAEAHPDKERLEAIEDKMGFVPVAETPEYIQAMQIIEMRSKEIQQGI